MKYILTSLLSLVVASLLLAPPAAAARKTPPPRPAAKMSALEPDAMAARTPQEPRAKRPAAQSAAPTAHGHVNALYREGIDVSHYQGRIDWDRVASAHISYAYMKATEGASYVDDTYEYNLREARRVGLSVGSYHFYRPGVAPEVQVANMTAVVRAEEQDLVPIVDIEARGSVSEAQFVADLREFVRLVEEAYGKKPLLYSYQNFYNRHLRGAFPHHHWMIAKYQAEEPILSDGRPYAMWQYTSSGRIEGIRGNVDRSRLMDGFTLQQLAF